MKNFLQHSGTVVPPVNRAQPLPHRTIARREENEECL